MEKNILITGVAGFLGSNLVAKYLTNGYQVFGVDNLSMGSLDNLEGKLEHDNFHFIKGDITDKNVLDTIDEKVDLVVHLAAFKIPRYGNALATLKINYSGTENVLDFSVKNKAKCVLASTSDVYGRNPNLPFSEDQSDCVIGSSLSPRWAYAVSKLFDEHLALAYQAEYRIPVVLLRFFGSYGPNQPLSWWGGPPPVFINAVLRDEEIPIHGDGSQTRSFTYVDDTVEGIYFASVKDEASGEIINIGSNAEISILELAKLIKKLSGTDGELKYRLIPYKSFTGKKYEDVMRRVPDITKCESLLGVKAETSLEDGLMKTIAWQREQEKRGRKFQYPPS